MIIKLKFLQILLAMKVVRFIFRLLIFLILATTIFFFGYYFAATKDAQLYPEKLVFCENNVRVFDGENQPVKTVSALTCKNTVRLQDIPKHTQQAFIDTEDKRFFSHNGFDVKRIAKAFLKNLKAKGFKEGASTISQQLIKNTHLSQEKTVKRKLKEWKLTRALEKKYSKEEILEKYLNTIYFGHSCFGIASACEYYFDKPAQQLTLADSAILAGLVRSPNNYSPFTKPENCLKRKQTVLTLMQNNGSITQNEKNAALAEPLPTPTKKSVNGGYFPHLFNELTEITEQKNIRLGGKIEIYTYLNPRLQNQLEDVASTIADTDKALLVLDRQTRGFKACVSSCTLGKRLPGSLIKPLLVYAPALEENILVPATPILDEKVNYNGYSPQNYDGKFHGYVSARECVAQSLNVPAVKILQSVGVSKAAGYMSKLNLPVEKEDESLALALGGMKRGYAFKDLLTAYSAFPDGKFEKGGFISAIKIDGVTVYKKPNTPKSVFSEETAYLMTDMLKTAAKTGTAKKLRSLPFEIAAKTGTVGTEKGNTDAYALSYTTRDCVGVWVGNADNRPILHTGGGLPCNALLKINEHLKDFYQARGENIPAFPKPNSIVKISLDKPSYYDTHTILLADDAAPQEQTFFELFKNSAIPLNKSTSFTFPMITAPYLSVVGNQVSITFDDSFPSYYEYTIDRYDYVTHTTVYQGGYTPLFTDTLTEKDKTYLYTVTPSFQGKTGKSVPLPSVSTKEGEQLKDKEMLQKEWWEY